MQHTNDFIKNAVKNLIEALNNKMDLPWAKNAISLRKIRGNKTGHIITTLTVDRKKVHY